MCCIDIVEDIVELTGCECGLMDVVNELVYSSFVCDDDDASEPFGQFQLVFESKVVDHPFAADFKDVVGVGGGL